MSFMVDVKEIQVSKYGLTKVGKTPVLEIAFISGSGVMRGHGKTPLFMAGMKCLPHRHVPLLPSTRADYFPIAPTQSIYPTRAYKILCNQSTGDRER